MLKLRVTLLVALATAPAAAAQWAYTNTGAGELRGLSAASDSVVWASGSRGSVVRSVDGGRTWRADSVAGATHLDFRSILAISADIAVIASAGEAEKGLAHIRHTGDGGRSWTSLWETADSGVFLDALAAWDSHTWVALSDPTMGSFGLFMTGDGGTSWLRLPPAGMPPVLTGEAAFAASGSSLVTRGRNEMWIGTGGGGRARVMHSADRGATWSVAETPVHAAGGAAGIFALAFFDSRHGVAVGGDYLKRHLAATSVALTTDGGRTWRAATSPPAAYLSGVAYAGSASRLVAVGLAGTFASSDGGNSWMQVDTIPLNAVRFRGTNGWAAGPRGRVARWTP